jgi:hypothetical protein
VAKRTSRRGRSRKRRPPVAAPPVAAPPRREAAVERQAASARGGGGSRAQLSAGERPQAPWHPWPLSEILILAGAIATVIGFTRGEAGRGVLLAGIGAAAIGTLEVTLREHVTGYRSHTIMLALLPTLAFHSAVILLLAAFMRVPRLVNVALLLIDAPLFAFLFRLLRARYLDARRERSFAGAR